jgi:hypothetical protein
MVLWEFQVEHLQRLFFLWVAALLVDNSFTVVAVAVAEELFTETYLFLLTHLLLLAVKALPLLVQE